MSDAVLVLRRALTEINVTELGWKAADTPDPGQIFTPVDHDGALDPDRAVVVGNRGVGKSFWSAVLSHPQTRQAIHTAYPRLGLDRTEIRLGFHEQAASGFDAGPAPSVASFDSLAAEGMDPFDLWRGALLAALREAGAPEQGPADLDGRDALARWAARDPLGVETALRRADGWFADRGRKFVLLFDALDRLGKSWDQIRPRTEAALRLALHLRASRALRVKLFLRSDQFADPTLFAFPDASKLRQESVSLVWRRRDLYGLLFQRLWSGPAAREALLAVAGPDAPASWQRSADLPFYLASDEVLQAFLFYRICGEYMGAGPSKGRTYSWLHDHLSDAAGETSPRSFLAALTRAATNAQGDSRVLTYKDLQTGVQHASATRLDQLKEDYGWIRTALEALDGLQVPSLPDEFIGRWRDRNTVGMILKEAGSWLSPLSLADDPADPESRLLEELVNINVLERRSNGKINMPDIFRVAARIKRKGGLRPPPLPGRR
ncbi:hypothetical protein [Phaeospirillum tilakii]|uniref:AAA ATPase domain-containing protein n=1 Tax=Phaeospirillum tilakii TaxID=741673 RepID=A0ABW5C9H1_9PROT